jgi:DNA-binding NarL/FixJ family response regulator
MSTNNTAPSLILVIDEHSIYRHGLRTILEANIDHGRVVEASTPDGVDDSLCFDLILIDCKSISQKTIALLKEVHERSPQTRIAVMSVSNTRADVINCLAAGFHGFIYKLQSDGEFVGAVRDLLSGRIYVPRWLADDTHDARPERPPSVNMRADRLSLTPRQWQIIPLLAQGLSNKEIARALCIAEGTAKVHTAAALRVLGARNRTEAAFLAAKLLGTSSRSQPRLTGRFGMNVPSGLRESA